MDKAIGLKNLPLVIAGPILRHCDKDNFTLWFVTSKPVSDLTVLFSEDLNDVKISLNSNQIHHVPLGQRAHQYLIQLAQDDLFPVDRQINYQIFDDQGQNILSHIGDLTYADHQQPHFIIKSNIDNLLHGSCRNPHHESNDALVTADAHISEHLNVADRPALLMMSGDQVYVDDIAAPMLHAIGQVIELLGLPHEKLPQANINNTSALTYDPSELYQRDQTLLPHNEFPIGFHFFRWYHKQPIFTSRLSHNHLVGLSEMTALYLLIWSPELWSMITLPETVAGLSSKHQQQWQRERSHIVKFHDGLSQVRRLMAHIPTYMIFDDHDITDDWNLTAKWEQAAYEHPFSKRILGNALIAYTLFQGLGNAPKKFEHIQPQLTAMFASPELKNHDQLIDILLRFEDWHYHLNTSPKLVVLDTRTRRWRSESNLAKPSGLLDWEALMEFQHELVGQDKVIIVSAAPMFGVKLIETIQRIATFFGQELAVDAENWMAHPGAAECLLNIFRHRKTPQEFVILSGDVHYSFAYDVHLRFNSSSPNIYQICCSGIKNQFPEKLLPCFDKLNGWLYGYFSPLNLFTKRKRMLIRGRRPNQHRSKRLVNNSGIGLVHFADNGAPTKIAVLHGNGETTEFGSPRESYFK
ncbi:MAG: alkaline phosphatase D family protein [Parashewanella sp.]